MSHFVFVDCETGGLDPKVHGITEIAAIAFDFDTRNPFGHHECLNEFQVLIQPNRELAYAPAALAMQDRTLDYLEEYGMSELHACNAFFAFLCDQINWHRPHTMTQGSIIAHYAQFDYGFLAALAERCGQAEKLPTGNRCDWICTKNLFRVLSGLGIVAPRGCGLTEIMKWYGVDFEGKQHNALVDCKAGVQVFRHEISDLKHYYEKETSK